VAEAGFVALPDLTDGAEAAALFVPQSFAGLDAAAGLDELPQLDLLLDELVDGLLLLPHEEDREPELLKEDLPPPPELNPLPIEIVGRTRIIVSARMTKMMRDFIDEPFFMDVFILCSRLFLSLGKGMRVMRFELIKLRLNFQH